MEFVGPGLSEVIRSSVQDGVSFFDVFPLFLSSGGHVATDIPSQIREANGLYPEITIRQLPCLGENSEYLKTIRQIISALLQV
jgi:sirohydrochlorin ferrochelatase